MKKKKLYWYVMTWQNGEYKSFNLFDNEDFEYAIKKIDYSSGLSYEQVRTQLSYYFKGRFEYEICVSDAFGNKQAKENVKLSVYDQVMPNFEIFMEYLRSSL